MRTRTKRILLGASISVAVVAYLGYGVVEPQTAAGHAAFFLGYSLPPTRPAFLHFYGCSLREFNGGYLPGSVDEFLAGRLWECRGSREWQAILDFQIAQTSARWGDSIAHVQDDLKRDIIGDLIRRLDTLSPGQSIETLLFIETLRRSDALHKGGFTGLSTLTPDRLATAKERFRTWWADGSSWPANKATDPLHETGIAVHNGP